MLLYPNFTPKIAIVSVNVENVDFGTAEQRQKPATVIQMGYMGTDKCQDCSYLLGRLQLPIPELNIAMSILGQ